MTVLDIDKGKPNVVSPLAAGDKIIHQPGNFGVGHAGVIRRNAKSRVEHRMVIEDGGLEPGLLVGPRKPPRVGQLKADEEVVGRAKAELVLLDQRRSQGCDRGFRAVNEQELVGIRAPVVAHRNRLASPDQLGAALPEALPAAHGEVAGFALPGPVPAFHRENAEPVSDGPAFEPARAGQRRFGARFQSLVKLELNAQRGKVRAERLRRFERRDSDVGGGLTHASPTLYTASTAISYQPSAISFEHPGGLGKLTADG